MSEILDQREAIATAKKSGMTIVKGDSTHLLLDLDTKGDELFYDVMFPVVNEHITITETERWRSKTGGLHVLLTTDRHLSLKSRLLIQACLGSDRKKEFLCLARLLRLGEKQPVMLFKPSKEQRAAFARLDKPKKNKKSIEPDDDVPF